MGKSRLSKTQKIEPVIDNFKREDKIEELFKEEKKKKEKVKKTGLQKVRDVIVSIFTIIVIIACWYAIIVKMILKVDVPMVAGYSALVVLSGSMEPTIMTGEVIVIHEESDSTFVTRGDANNTNDAPIKKSQAVGKTIFHIPYLGRVILFVQSPIGLASVLAILIALKVMYSLLRTKQEDLEL